MIVWLKSTVARPQHAVDLDHALAMAKLTISKTEQLITSSSSYSVDVDRFVSFIERTIPFMIGWQDHLSAGPKSPV